MSSPPESSVAAAGASTVEDYSVPPQTTSSNEATTVTPGDEGGEGGGAAGGLPQEGGEQGGGGGDGGGGGSGAMEELSMTELLYSAASYHAIVKPVSVTMILAALATVFVNTEQIMEEYGQGMADAYQVLSLNPEVDSAGATFGKAVTNALVMVSVVGAMTFLIVLLYKYKCMKCLIGYMIFSSAALLGLLGGIMFDVAINKYRIPVSWPTFVLILWNFAAVGVVAIFYQKGIPPFVNQSYLVLTSVILSWQLSHFDEWTAWTLLAMLALYDLCAVLTPCGPLKLLVNLMQEDDSPDMPGLLYEAELPAEARRPRPLASRSNLGRSRTQSSSGSGTNNGGNGGGGSSGGGSRSRHSSSGSGGAVAGEAQPNDDAPLPREERFEDEDEEDEEEATPTTPLTGSRPRASGFTRENNGSGRGDVELPSVPDVSAAGAAAAEAGFSSPIAVENLSAAAKPSAAAAGSATPTVVSIPPPTGFVPLAIAKIYRLPLVNPSSVPSERNATTSPLLRSGASGSDEGGGAATAAAEGGGESPNEALARQYTPQELRSDVEVAFPRNGGRIVTRPGSDGSGNRYVVLDRHGNQKRVLLVDERGKVFEETYENGGSGRGGGGGDDDGSVYEETANSIKLGLGDFIFYSVLVGKAALYSFATFAACMLVILAGLGGTLVLLAVWKQALPALPISIFLGVTFYLLTRIVIEPWIEDVMRTPLYV